MSRPRKLSHDPKFPVCLGTLSRHNDACHDPAAHCNLISPVALTKIRSRALLHTQLLGRARMHASLCVALACRAHKCTTQRALSRPGISCRDRNLEFGSSPFHLSPTHFFFFSTHYKTHRKLPYSYKGHLNMENSLKCIYYTKRSLITICI